MKKIILNNFRNSLFNLELKADEELIGNLSVYVNKNEGTAWLDLLIEENWQSRWLTKSFAKFIFQTFMQVAKEYNLQKVYTCLNNTKSLRLLEFFGFTHYNKKYYFLTIL